MARAVRRCRLPARRLANVTWDDLSPVERLFVEAFVSDPGRGAIAAAVAAGCEPGGQAMGMRRVFLAKPLVAAMIRKQRIRRQVDSQWVLNRYMQEAVKVDLAWYEDYLRGEVSLKELHDRGVPTHMIDSVRERTVTDKEGSCTVTREIRLKRPKDGLDPLKELLVAERAAGPERDRSQSTLPDAANIRALKDLKMLLDKSLEGVYPSPQPKPEARMIQVQATVLAEVPEGDNGRIAEQQRDLAAISGPQPKR